MADKTDIQRLALRAKCANAVVAATNTADSTTDDGTFEAIHAMANDLTVSTQMALARALGMIGPDGDVLEGAAPEAGELWAGIANDDVIDRLAGTALHSPRLLGYQIADQFGENIQGDEGDPSGEPSYRVLSMEEANAIMEDPANRDLLLMPIREGDIENPTLPA